MLEGGWHFVPKELEASNNSPASAHDDQSFPHATVDYVHGFPYLNNLYKKADPQYADRFTVPVIWDKKTDSIVNNESSEVIRFLNTGFNSMLSGKEKELDLYPEALRKEIDELNDWVYNDLNNGVYKSGFATKQEVYNSHVKKVFEALDKVEKHLEDGREFLFGTTITEADIRCVIGRRARADWLTSPDCSRQSSASTRSTSSTSNAILALVSTPTRAYALRSPT